MRYKKKLIGLSIVLAALAIVQAALPYRPQFTEFYANYIFVPYQSLRNILFGWSPLSFGDLLYFAGGLAILALLVKWIFFIITIRKNGVYLFHSFLNTVMTVAVVYLLFLLGWGGNYYKPSLVTYWHMDKTEWTGKSSLVFYDSFLIDRLNTYAVCYKDPVFKDVRKEAMKFYKDHTDCKTRLQGLNIKPSIYGFLMQHLGIQGYYNPITGEAQVNRFLPAFMLPFVVVHEMAHQAGIAAEDDANLVAYILSIKSGDDAFRYSAYFNMWLYNHYRLKVEDSALADEMKMQLNPMTLAHVDTLKSIRARYKSDFSFYSTRLYDVYLKMLQQKEGIRSYNKSTISAFTWETSPDSIRNKRLELP